ncbi:MAG: lytic transglycosylase domain-containing protein [Clostridiales bacterium]|nr:lytic transglycosylase domain-containing protein [Clostridiales bacterium]
MRRRIIILFIIVIVLSILAVIGYFKSPHYRRQVYPLYFKEFIDEHSREYNVDPYLVAAIIWTESKFRPDARSHKDATGLMQITPETGKWIAKMQAVDGFKVEDLYDPDLNIHFGCWYLNKLKAEFNGNIENTLAAYNGGSGNVKKWLADKRYSEDGKTLYHIPFKETREYLDRVKGAYREYKALYDLK